MGGGQLIRDGAWDKVPIIVMFLLLTTIEAKDSRAANGRHERPGKKTKGKLKTLAEEQVESKEMISSVS